MPAMNLLNPVRLAAALLLGALLAAGAAHSQAAEPAQRLTLNLGDYHFTPDTLQVHAAKAVELTLINTDTLTPHNFTLQAAEAGLDIDTNVSAGSKAVVEFTPVKAGSYTFFCNKKLPFMKSHRDRGMEGTLQVLPTSTD